MEAGQEGKGRVFLTASFPGGGGAKASEYGGCLEDGPLLVNRKHVGIVCIQVFCPVNLLSRSRFGTYVE